MTFCNIYYSPAAAAKQFYATRSDLCFINGGSSLFPTTDKWILDNVQPDNTGDNISHLNSRVNEWTTLYWIRHHLDMFDSSRIGFCHYRLMFSEMPSDSVDISVAKPIAMIFRTLDGRICCTDIENGFRICHLPYVWDIIEDATCKCVDKQIFNSWKSQKALTSPCMLFDMRKELFVEMFDFCWPLIETIMSRIDYSKIDTAYQYRQVAFVGERLFSLWVYMKTSEGKSVEELNTIKCVDFKPISDADERKMKL